ncbi:mannosyltransferase family protein [Nonomuraea salmonea]|uniref:mannosyltransferase family protein n=1 Tax=Nonomuraea salmonea TaxID=46181 RepID=UPI002FE8E90C
MITRSATRDALLLWFGSRAGLLVATLLGATLAGYPHRWSKWDTTLFVTIAEYGYDGEPGQPADDGLPAFFPGLPLALRLVHLVVPDWAAAGLVVSLVSGAVAMVALARLAETEGAHGWAAVLGLLAFPMAVFLAAGYSESLFLAFAIPAWLAARQGRWPLAVVLAAGGVVRADHRVVPGRRAARGVRHARGAGAAGRVAGGAVRAAGGVRVLPLPQDRRLAGVEARAGGRVGGATSPGRGRRGGRPGARRWAPTTSRWRSGWRSPAPWWSWPRSSGCWCCGGGARPSTRACRRRR